MIIVIKNRLQKIKKMTPLEFGELQEVVADIDGFYYTDENVQAVVLYDENLDFLEKYKTFDIDKFYEVFGYYPDDWHSEDKELLLELQNRTINELRDVVEDEY